jgi:hypothetical protein
MHLDLSRTNASAQALSRVLSISAPPLGQLEAVLLRGVASVDDGVVIGLCVAHGSSLRSLDISGSGISGRSVVALAKHCRRLEALDLSFTRGVREDSLGALVESGTLQSLAVWGCSQLSQRLTQADGRDGFKMSGFFAVAQR